MKYSIVIPAYICDIELVQVFTKMLESLKKHTPEEYELIIVDNGSKYMQEEMMEVADIYIRNKENMGFTRAINQGAGVATYDEYNGYYVFLNDDLELTPNWLERLIEPLTWDVDTLKTKGFPVVSTIRYGDADPEGEMEGYEEEVKFGCIWAIDQSSFRRNYFGLDEQFKQRWSDTDLWKRIHMVNGLTTVKNLKGFVYHRGKATLNKVDPDDKQYEIEKELYLKKWGELD